ncbi:aminoacyl-tRNA hydrolase [Cognatishimia sp. F0-27]|uniref:aminoacyl-tRNA hydrolase n=1 Tax=Cognatishimia sp. F0-27 TaxID=2816855 RepID=UPI001D0C59BB|nr:aminoacyl-tRNA hydrolase [Cognatishimia sp. F0-27]MCC1493237.1 aminoacyl-tRNA hydrolase [Cognatishimia sp. F0-27]
MQIFAGLGNPGSQYAGNRHNIGFMVLDRIAEDHGFGPWRSKFQGQVSEGRLGREKVLLLKPETFMNRSGQSVGEALRFYKLDVGALTVFHDELDLVPGKVRVKKGGGHAGHNGLRSIHQHAGPDYARVRLGIGHPGRKELVAGYVLHDFARGDQDWLDDVLRGCSDGAAALAAGDAGGFQNAVALRVNPPRSGGGAQGRPGAAQTAQAKEQAAKATPQAKDTKTPDTDTKPQEAAASDARSALQRLADKFR